MLNASLLINGQISFAFQILIMFLLRNHFLKLMDSQLYNICLIPPHLPKSTCNMFFQHLLKINEDLVDKKHLDNFYNYDGKCKSVLHLN